MRIKLLLAIIVIAVSCNVQKKVSQQATILANAMKTHQYETTMKFTHPKVVEMLGGEKKYLKILTTGGQEMKKMVIDYKSIELGKPSAAVKAGSELHCLIPETITMQLKDGLMVSKSHLIAVSKDKGKNWTFIETMVIEGENLKKILPNYNPELVIPINEEPQYIKN